MFLRKSLELTLATVCAIVISGCTSGDSGYSVVDTSESEIGHGDHEEHGHGQHGPNGGDIVELGNEEFHAEVVVDESAHRIDIFILGSDAATAKAIEVSEISLTFKHGDEVEEFKLAAVTLDGEPEGQSSKFTLNSEDAFEELHRHSEGATLSFTVGDQTLTGTVIHSHSHDEEHGHDHGEASHGDNHDDHGKHADHKPGEDKAADGHGTTDEPAHSVENQGLAVPANDAPSSAAGNADKSTDKAETKAVDKSGEQDIPTGTADDAVKKE
ncbi:MAG: hypothetical protein O3B86_02900 [Planctomycetota bacterium]|nr:hypothetical protein [Planctomycetota bacterium]